MSAFKRNIIYINVTRGDCVENNRKSGKSNTGTYFVCSEKNFSEYKYFFSEANIYKFALWNIEPYRLLFNAFFKSLSEEYKGKMANFDEICSKLSAAPRIPTVKVGLRINDSRYFMKFENNCETYTNMFRNILYEDLSLIAIEEIDNIFYIYPVINDKYIIKEVKDNSTCLVFEEE